MHPASSVRVLCALVSTGLLFVLRPNVRVGRAYLSTVPPPNHLCVTCSRGNEVLCCCVSRTQVEDFRDSNVNLGINQYAAFEPPLAPKRKYRDVEYTMWDTIDIDAATVQDVLDFFDKMDMEVGRALAVVVVVVVPLELP